MIKTNQAAISRGCVPGAAALSPMQDALPRGPGLQFPEESGSSMGLLWAGGAGRAGAAREGQRVPGSASWLQFGNQLNPRSACKAVRVP